VDDDHITAVDDLVAIVIAKLVLDLIALAPDQLLAVQVVVADQPRAISRPSGLQMLTVSPRLNSPLT
jgi:hypothetical protein